MEGLLIVHAGKGRELDFGTGGWDLMGKFEIDLSRRVSFTAVRSSERSSGEGGIASPTDSIMSQVLHRSSRF